MNREILIPIKENNTYITEVNTAYTSRDGNDLLQQYGIGVGSDTSGEYFRRTSGDNGRTWSEPSLIYKPEQTEKGVLRRIEACFFRDKEKDAILHFYDCCLYPNDMHSREVGKFTRIFFEISFDGGKTFNKQEQIIQKGFDAEDWAKGVIYGRNSAVISFCAPMKTSDKKIILPVQRNPLDYDRYDQYKVPGEAGCFVGEWKGDNIEWELSEMVRIDPKLSSRGLCEPAIAELSNGSFLMIMRGSNNGIPDKPGYKWRSVSEDKGYTWSKPEPLKYDMGGSFFSPATGSRLIRSSKNKKLYWISNIVKENPEGNRPRYPLQIAEVDEDKRAIIKETVNIVEDRQSEDSPLVQFSNFRVYEDRETKEFVLIMAREEERAERDCTSPAYQYRIEI